MQINKLYSSQLHRLVIPMAIAAFNATNSFVHNKRGKKQSRFSNKQFAPSLRVTAQREQQRVRTPSRAAASQCAIRVPQIAQVAIEEPFGFTAGVLSSLLGLGLDDEPINTWLRQVAITGGIPLNESESEQQSDEKQ